MGEQRNKPKSEEDVLKEAEETLKMMKGSGEKQVANDDVVSNDKEESEESKTEDVSKKGKKKSTKKIVRKRVRSVKYRQAVILVDKTKLYPIEEALELAKKTSYTKFDGSIEVHAKLSLKKGQEAPRGLLNFNHNLGKIVKVALVDDALIEKITKDGKTEFEVLVATPQMMPKLARIAKILGPQGKMPNPKAGTVTDKPDKIIEEIKKGRIEFKADKSGVVHQIIGKASWETAKLQENYKTLISALPKSLLQCINISATMGPGIKVDLK